MKVNAENLVDQPERGSDDDIVAVPVREFAADGIGSRLGLPAFTEDEPDAEEREDSEGGLEERHVLVLPVEIAEDDENEQHELGQEVEESLVLAFDDGVDAEAGPDEGEDVDHHGQFIKDLVVEEERAVIHGAAQADEQIAEIEDHVAEFVFSGRNHQHAPQGHCDVEDVGDGVPEFGDVIAHRVISLTPVDTRGGWTPVTFTIIVVKVIL